MAGGPGNRAVGGEGPFSPRQAKDLVHWREWGPEAFEAAEAQDRPVFLFISSSSCHWCHIMERECFQDAEVAELVNDSCVSVRVDREERPDLDSLFTEICKIQNGSGGWPLNVFLTSRGEPFFAAGWLPKRTIGRLPGMADIIPRVKWLWLMQREDVLLGARSLVETLVARSTFPLGGHLGVFQIKSALRELKRTFDEQWGGFGTGPKFPCAPRLLFLLEYARRGGPESEDAFRMADLTLRKMWAGGIHDHLGGGYARCSTDERWITPRFEKMLCDQAMLLWVASLAQETRACEFYVRFAEDIVACVMRDFTSPESCFYTSVDADSEGEEGRYYLWTDDEIRAALPSGDAGIFAAAYAVMPCGNFAHEVTGMRTGRNVLYETASVREIAERYGLRPDDLARRLENDRKLLLEVRGKRTPPLCDDRAMMSRNGLMIGALARAGRVFEKKEWILAAERAALFLQKALVDSKGGWRRRYRAKEAAVPALPGDYAAMMWGVMELYRAASMDRQKKDWLKYAGTLAAKLEENYWDDARGGLFLSGVDPYIFLRRKAAADDAVPSANALAMMAYIAMARADGDKKHMGTAKSIRACFTRITGLLPAEHISILTASMGFYDAAKEEKEKKEKTHLQKTEPEKNEEGNKNERDERYAERDPEKEKIAVRSKFARRP